MHSFFGPTIKTIVLVNYLIFTKVLWDRSEFRLFLMATWKSGLGNHIYYIQCSVKPVKWPVADGGEEKVAFPREFF